MRSALVAAVLGVAGCGGLVVFVEEDGGQGGNGAGTQSSTSGPPLGTPCEQLCAGAPGCETPPDCLENCESNYTPAGCEAEADALFLCQLESFDPVACAVTDLCSTEIDVLHACQDAQ